MSRLGRRDVVGAIAAAAASIAPRALAARPSRPRVLITAFGARADGVTINTRAIQAAIDSAAQGGGVVVVSAGVFVSGALFLRPRVDLHLEDGAVLRCTTKMEHFPAQRTRIEGHFEAAFTPALINAKGCDGLRITGKGVLDGAGREIWERFWALRNAAPDPANFPNLGLPRARLALIEDSRRVTIEDVAFKDSQFWNLHLYRCRDVVVRRARFTVPDDYKQAPSSDGIDIDSSQRVIIEDCYFSVTDDCIAAKGSKGPFALEDRESPPVEHIRVRRCHFRRGHQALACGSEATIVRDVLVEDCKVTGPINVLMLKLRPDTPQVYENIRLSNITLDSDGGTILAIGPWSQYKDLKGAPPPLSHVRGVVLEGFRGRFGAFGHVRPNRGQTTIAPVQIKDFDLRLARSRLAFADVPAPVFDKVTINGQAVAAP
ncbi:glycoside hydrolase family 28 protein [Caulobacter endophyticus]|uniref:glycoside hydrolase family 28 protein n=1 Tax=Caulobacter endophyticus TaxID=2172652 RepID=UPI002410252D|nr:glycosyl hydrolase family 28 protein [Caulobacter endophyticus]MDG2528150.1 glycosyl hydrolase family 28 protein [Caulobacter endophyticus]